MTPKPDNKILRLYLPQAQIDRAALAATLACKTLNDYATAAIVSKTNSDLSAATTKPENAKKG